MVNKAFLGKGFFNKPGGLYAERNRANVAKDRKARLNGNARKGGPFPADTGRQKRVEKRHGGIKFTKGTKCKTCTMFIRIGGIGEEAREKTKRMRRKSRDLA